MNLDETKVAEHKERLLSEFRSQKTGSQDAATASIPSDQLSS
jgi:hypothetical protein